MTYTPNGAFSSVDATRPSASRPLRLEDTTSFADLRLVLRQVKRNGRFDLLLQHMLQNGRHTNNARRGPAVRVGSVASSKPSAELRERWAGGEITWIKPLPHGPGSPGTAIAGWQPAHDFHIAQTPTTRSQWKRVADSSPWAQEMGLNPDPSRAPIDPQADPRLCPVDSVSWWDCIVFCVALAKLEALEPAYWAKRNSAGQITAGPNPRADRRAPRLPYEAEWEWCARAGGSAERHGIWKDGKWIDNGYSNQ